MIAFPTSPAVNVAEALVRLDALAVIAPSLKEIVSPFAPKSLTLKVSVILAVEVRATAPTPGDVNGTFDELNGDCPITSTTDVSVGVRSDAVPFPRTWPDLIVPSAANAGTTEQSSAVATRSRFIM